jgi:hypothetical protein
MMDEDFSSLFKESLKFILTQIEDISPSIFLQSNDSKKTYELTHRYQSSKNTFLGFDPNREKVHLKIFPCSSFKLVQSASMKLKRIYETCSENSLIKILDKLIILDKGRWFFVVVTKTICGVNLFDFSEFLHSRCENMSKDLCIAILLVLLDFLKYNKSSVKLDSLYPNTVMICKNSGGLPFARFKKENYNILVLPLSKKTLLGQSTRLDPLYRTSENDLWGLGITIYGLIGTFPYSLLPDLRPLDLSHVLDVVPLREQDPALEKIFRIICSSNTLEVTLHSYLKIWGGIYQKNWESIDLCAVDQIEVLHSGLFFSDPVSRKLVIKKMLVLGKNDTEIYEYLVSRDLFGVFIDKCIRIDWKECPELLEPFYKFLRYKPKDHEYKGKLGELGILGLVNTTLELDPHNRGFLNFVQDFAYENTLTLLQILYDKGVVSRSIKVAKNSTHDRDFLSHSMSFYGPHAVKVIEQVFNSELFSNLSIIEALIEIPYQYKLEKISSLMKLLLTVIKKSNCKDEFEIIKSALNLITEIICLPVLLQQNHVKGGCSSHSDEDFLLSKNKFLINCTDCNVPVCSSCHQSLHKSHNCYYMLHITPHFRCNCVDIHNMSNIKPADFVLPKYGKGLVFTGTNGQNYPETESNYFSTEHDLIITSAKSLESIDRDSMICYFEVRVNRAGSYENIVVGLLGPEIYYHGMNGSVTLKKAVIGKAPRFGSYDNVGVGLLKDFHVFITFNGLLLNQLFKCEDNVNAKLFIGMFGGSCAVEVKVNHFLFLKVQNGLDSFVGESKKSLEELFKVFINVLKKSCESRMPELKKPFEKLLNYCNRTDLIKKLNRRSLF